VTLRSLAPDLWVAEQPLRFLGLEVGTRMTVARLPGGRLWLHSPIERSRALAAEVEEHGEPAFVVAPNRLHHLYASEWRTAYPASQLYAAPGLDAKRPDLAIDAVLGDAPPPAWSDVLDQALVGGYPFANEVVFFHRPSRTLIASDLFFHVGEEAALPTRLAFRAMGAYGRPATTPLERLLIRDRAAFRRSLDRILGWPIERVVMAHGSVIETGGRAAVAEAYAWLLGRA
jgi:hypothetical protein